MSALSVMSLIVPTAPVGANAASVDTAADDGLFAGLVAAVAPSTTAQGEGDAPPLDAPLAEADAAETPSLDLAVDATTAWPLIPLIAPSPLPVAPSTPAAVSGGVDAPPAGTSPAAPAAPAPSPEAEAAAAPMPPADKASLAVPTSSPDAPAARPDLAKAPVASPVSPLLGVAPAEARPAQPLPAAAPGLVAAAETPVAPVQSQAQADATPPQADAAPRPAAPTVAPDARPAPVAVDKAARPRLEGAAALAPSQAPSAIAMTAASVPASPAAPVAAPATQSAPLAAQAPAPLAEAAAPVAPVATSAPRPNLAVAPTPAAPSSTPAAPAVTPVAAPTESAEQAVVMAAATASSDAEPEAEAAPQTPPPATAAPAPARNGSARLDERRSNAATANAPAEARADASIGARSILPTSTPSLAAPAATAAALGDAAAPAPLATADAAPLDAQPDLAPSQQQLDAQTAAPTAHRDLGLSQLSRATVETTAQLAAQIIKKLEGRSTRFDMALTPEGLGRVDVSLEIDSEGRLAARLAFDNPAAATDMRARADELRRQLQDSGFQLTQDSLEFSERNPSSGFSGGGAFERAPDRRAFAGAARLAAQADTTLPPPGAWASLSLTPDRVDMKV